jgi:hypothetical protein
LPDESFGLQWQRETSARAAVAAGQTKKTATGPVPEAVDANEHIAPSKVEKGPTESPKERGESKVEAESSSDTAPKNTVAAAVHNRSTPPVSAAAPVKAKGAAATPEPSDPQQETKPVGEAGSDATAVAMAAAQGSIPAGDAAAAVKIAVAASTQASAKPASPDAKRPAAIGETERSTVAHPAQPASGGVPAVVTDTKTPTTTDHPAGEPAGVGANALGGHANVENAPTLPPGLQLSSTAVAAAAQTLAPNHGATLSALTGTPAGASATAQGGALNGHQVLGAAPTQLDVGVFDGTHGWLRIRAELGTGGDVSASLTASAAAHGALRAAVPEMSNYLAAESVSVSKIAVHRAAEGSIGMGLTPGGSGQNGDSQDRKSGPQTQGDAGVMRKTSVQVSGSSPVGAAGSGDWTRGRSLPMPWVGTAVGSGGGSGSWLNVRA